MKWFNLQDVHRDKAHARPRSRATGGRIARSHAKHARHIDIPQVASGRPMRVTLLTADGIAALYEPGETLPKLTPYAPPMRLTDRARAHILGGGLVHDGRPGKDGARDGPRAVH
jgi:hypothetical protein